MINNLLYLSQKALGSLKDTIEGNYERYLGDGFEDMSDNSSWKKELNIKVDLSPLSTLTPQNGKDFEVANAIIVWSCLSDLSPSLASEEQLWTRISHVEAFEYTQKRWLNKKTKHENLKSISMLFRANLGTFHMALRAPGNGQPINTSMARGAIF